MIATQSVPYYEDDGKANVELLVVNQKVDMNVNQCYRFVLKSFRVSTLSASGHAYVLAHFLGEQEVSNVRTELYARVHDQTDSDVHKVLRWDAMYALLSIKLHTERSLERSALHDQEILSMNQPQWHIYSGFYRDDATGNLSEDGEYLSEETNKSVRYERPTGIPDCLRLYILKPFESTIIIASMCHKTKAKREDCPNASEAFGIATELRDRLQRNQPAIRQLMNHTSPIELL